MTEKQPYTVVRSENEFEVRHYPEHLVAEVEVDGSFEKAGNAAFRPLVSYISGRNAGGSKLAMTAPVLQQSAEPLDVPSASTTTVTDDGTYLVSFVLPADADPGTVPMPSDGRVTIRTVPAQVAAAMRYSGRWSASSYAQHVTRLQGAVAAAGLVADGPARFARFDPPWTPWFMRHNEVVLPVREH